jgi:hypothetical protein
MGGGGGGGKLVLSTLLLLKLGDQMLRPYIIQTASKCLALTAATSPPILGRKNTVICVQEKQMLTELNNKCVKATFQTGI